MCIHACGSYSPVTCVSMGAVHIHSWLVKHDLSYIWHFIIEERGKERKYLLWKLKWNFPEERERERVSSRVNQIQFPGLPFHQVKHLYCQCLVSGQFLIQFNFQVYWSHYMWFLRVWGKGRGAMTELYDDKGIRVAWGITCQILTLIIKGNYVSIRLNATKIWAAETKKTAFWALELIKQIKHKYGNVI